MLPLRFSHQEQYIIIYKIIKRKTTKDFGIFCLIYCSTIQEKPGGHITKQPKQDLFVLASLTKPQSEITGFTKSFYLTLCVCSHKKEVFDVTFLLHRVDQLSTACSNHSHN